MKKRIENIPTISEVDSSQRDLASVFLKYWGPADFASVGIEKFEVIEKVIYGRQTVSLKLRNEDNFFTAMFNYTELKKDAISCTLISIKKENAPTRGLLFANEDDVADWFFSKIDELKKRIGREENLFLENVKNIKIR